MQVFTSNVDGQFQRAGFAEADVLECHGSIHHLQCLNTCTTAIWSANGTEPDIDAETMRAVPPLPTCRRCGAPARPNILMFGDYDWLPARTDAASREHQDWLRRCRDRRDRLVVVEIGAGTAVPTVRRHAERIGGDALIRINTREPGVRRGVGINAPACEALTELEALVSG